MDASAKRHGAFASEPGASDTVDLRQAARLEELDKLRSKHGHQLGGPPSKGTIDQWKFLTPLVWAPLFPIIRMTTSRLSKRVQPWAVGFAILVANLHGFWLIQNPDLSDIQFGSGYEK